MPDSVYNQSNIITPGNLLSAGVFTNLLAAQPTLTISTPTTNAVIPTTSFLVRLAGGGGAAITGLDLAAGTVNGQVVIIENSNTTVANTLSFSGAHIMLDASSDAIIVKAASATMFVWDAAPGAASALWVHVGPFGG